VPFAHPRLRPDVICVKVPSEDESHYFYKNPLTNDFFRFNPLQHEMLRRLDGGKSVDEICRELSALHDEEIPSSVGEAFIEELRGMKLLDDLESLASDRKTRRQLAGAVKKALLRANLEIDPPVDLPSIEPSRSVALALKALAKEDTPAAADWLAVAREISPAEPLIQKYFDAFWRGVADAVKVRSRWAAFGEVVDRTILLGAFDSANLAKKLAPYLGFLFHLEAWFVCLAIGLSGMVLQLFAPEPAVDLGSGDTLIFYPLVLFFVLLHELWHAVALAYAGRRPGFIGCGLMHGFRPFFFTDTFESILVKKRQRIMVYLAGLEINFTMIFTLALLTYLEAFTPRLYANVYYFNWVLISVTLYNFIPFFRGDMYVVLEEALGQRDLDKNAYRFVRQAFAAYVLRAGDPPKLPMRTALFYTAFACGSAITLCVLFYWVMIGWLFNGLIQRLGFAGLILWFGCFVLIFGHQIRTTAKSLFMFVRSQLPLLRTRRGLIVFGVLVAVPLFVLLAVRVPLVIEAPLVIAPVERAYARAAESGFVAMILVEDRETVERGQLIAELSSPELDLELSRAVADLEVRRQKLAMIEAGARIEEVRLQTRGLERSAVALRRSSRDHRRQRALLAAGLVSSRDMERARSVDGEARGELSARATELEVVQLGNRGEDIGRARAEVQIAERWLAALEKRQRLLSIEAPSDGVVATQRLRERLGDYLKAGDVFLEIIDPAQLRAELEVSPHAPIDEIERGARIELRLSARPHEVVEALVENVAPRARADGRQVMIYSEPLVNAVAISELTGRGRIYGRPRSLAYRWFVRPVRRLVSYELWALD
jgi:multidrug resistance efflux pump